MVVQNSQAFVRLVRAALVGGALLGVCLLGPLIELIPNHRLRGFVLVELGLGGVVIVVIIAKRLAALSKPTSDTETRDGTRNS